MTVVDPIADMLTRIRNGLMAGHPLVAMPTSKMKTAVAGILKDEGYIEKFEVVTEDAPQGVLRVYLKYMGERREREPVITGPRAGQPARAPGVCQQARDSAGAFRAGCDDCLHPEGDHDRRPGAQARRGRRGDLQGVVIAGPVFGPDR